MNLPPNMFPFPYCVVSSEKEKQSCVCINCQNPQLLLKAVNRYRTSKNLNPHESLTKYLEKLKANKQFDELTEENVYTYHRYERVEEPYTKKDGTPGQYQRVTRVNHKEPVKDICQKILDTGNAYFKHRTCVDNVSSVFPEINSMMLNILSWTFRRTLSCVRKMKSNLHIFLANS